MKIKKSLIIVFLLMITILSALFVLVTKSNQKENEITVSSETEISNEVKILNEVKVSVIVPVYKAEKYIHECMDSIVNQTFKDIEIICIDDGSPDNSGKILDEYAQKDTRVHVIHQENAGVSAARNRGIDEAKGEYIKFVDSDDSLDLKACEICYNKSKEFDDADIVVHNAPKNEILKAPHFNLVRQMVTVALFKTNLIKDNNIKFKEKTSYGEDQAFNLICNPKANKIVTLTDDLYMYRMNSESLTHTANVPKASTSHAENIRYVYDDWKGNGYFDNDVAKINFLNWFCDMHIWKNDRDIDNMYLNSIGRELLEEKVLNLLPNDKKQEIERMISISGFKV